MEKTDKSIQEQLVQMLTNKGLKIATAESCTGGLLSEHITKVSGASAVFDCGVCSYANEIKSKLLGVKTETLEKYGAVSKQTAMEMAQGIRILSGADIGISTTGIAGPTGGTPEKPVGLVYIGISTEKETYFERCEFCKTEDLSREEIRQRACSRALELAYLSI